MHCHNVHLAAVIIILYVTEAAHNVFISTRKNTINYIQQPKQLQVVLIGTSVEADLHDFRSWMHLLLNWFVWEPRYQLPQLPIANQQEEPLLVLLRVRISLHWRNQIPIRRTSCPLHQMDRCWYPSLHGLCEFVLPVIFRNVQ